MIGRKRTAGLLPLAAAGLAIGLGLAAGPARADRDEWIPPVTDPLVRKECGSCHMAFPAGFLPARSWQVMMEGLSDHFGEDASLSPEDTAAITDWLTAHAGDRERSGLSRSYMRWVEPGGAPQRITENPAFLREHRFRPDVWERPDVVTRSNCPACHRGADQGYFEDD